MSEDDSFKKRLFDQLDAIEEKTSLVHAGIYGDENSEGLKKKVERHEKMLAMFYIADKNPKLVITAFLLLLFLCCYAADKGLDWTFTVITKFMKN